MSSTTSYWCYRCIRFVTVSANDDASIYCPHCESGFIEQIETDTNTNPDATSASPQVNPTRRFSRILSSSSSNGRDDTIPIPTRFRRRSRRNNHADRSPFNPVIVLRGTASSSTTTPIAATEEGSNRYEFFYDDGSGSGLRPVPETMSEFLMGWGFDRLLEQLTQIEVTRPGNPPASKAAVESLPTVEIEETHVVLDSQCAVCMEMFKLGCEATELPCKHMYHKDCIVPWLEMRNSCPVCRHELPVDESGNGTGNAGGEGEEGEQELVGLTIWRLPGGGFAVGRFRGEREREFPSGVFTEMDGEVGARPRRVSWVSGRRRSRGESGTDNSNTNSATGDGANRSSGGGGFGGVFRGLVSYLRRIGSRTSSNSRTIIAGAGSNLSSSLSNGNDDDPASAIRGSPSDSVSLESGRYSRRRRRRGGFDLELEN